MAEDKEAQIIAPERTEEKKSTRDYKREWEDKFRHRSYLTRFQSMGEDKFLSPRIARPFIVEQGYEAVRERVGKTNGWPFLWNQFTWYNPGGALFGAAAGATAASGGNYAEHPVAAAIGGLAGFLLGGSGQRIKPGFRFVVGLSNWWGRVAFVNMKLRTEDLPAQEVVTNDGIVLPVVDYILNWKVMNPVKALTKATNYKDTVREIAISRGREVVGKSSLDELDDLREGQRNLAYKDKDTKVDFPELQEIGVDIEGLYLRNFRYPKDLEDELAQAIISKKEAEGELAMARIRTDIAEQHRLAAAKYADNMEGARLVIARDILDEFAKNEKVTLIGGAGGIIGAMEDLIGKKQQKP